MRHEVKTFAQCMEHKLKKNDHKGGWEGVTNERLFELLRQEVDELEQAMLNEPTLNIVFEAADIANFAMMIGWNSLRQLVTPEQEDKPYVEEKCTACSGTEFNHEAGCPNEIPF